MLTATRRGLERAHREHAWVAQELPPPAASRHLLLVYAVECGLKAALMRRERAADTRQLGVRNHGHDLRAFVKELRLPRQYVLSSTRTRQDEPQPVEPRQLHEAFRYGIRLDGEERIQEELDRIMSWLRRELL
ncbi:MAG: hypothetical protein AB1634_15720 [Thermodesulfobacteriota bacterium]